MRIGLDFDNTLAQYDHVFAVEAKLEKLVPTEWEGTKKQLRDTLRSKENGEILWQKLQGKVYGPNMSQAELFPGVAQFLVRCKNRGEDVFVVSHKTEYGHYDSTKTQLREAALEWMELSGFFNKTKFGLTKDHVFFEKTREEKVGRISSLELDVYIDDLKEIFACNDFPDIEKILFTTIGDEVHNAIKCDNWTTIANEVLGPITDEDCKELAQTILNEKIYSVQKLQGGGNSRIYKVVTESSQSYAMKNYPDLLIDLRNRLQTEVQSCRILEEFHLTPKVFAYDVDLNIALFEWIDGEPIDCIENKHIDQALDFVKKLGNIEAPDFYLSAAEACTSADQVFLQIEHRLQQFESIGDSHLQQFLHVVFKPLFKDVRKWSEQHWPANNLHEELPKTKQTLSPSDFGFHNSLLQNDGRLCFLDLEYFGWDDPVKLIADFIWHPAMNLNETQKKRWVQECFKIFGQTEQMQQRFHAAWPLYGMRWVMIMLNEFRIDGWRKKIYVDENIEQHREQILSGQIEKANAVCALIKFHQMECPYV